MAPTRKSVTHTGSERIELVLEYASDELRQIERLAQPGEIIPDTVVVVWARQVGEPWQRYTKGLHGSRAEGYTKLGDTAPVGARGVRKTQEIFKRGSVPELKAVLAVLLPELRNTIEEAEGELPHPNVNPWNAGLTK